MNYTFTSLDEPQYRAFKNAVSEYQDNIIDFVSIADLRAQGLKDDDIAIITSRYFDKESPSAKDKAETPAWLRVDEASVFLPDGLISILAGGRNFAYGGQVMPQSDAKKLWEEFLGFFDKDTRVLYQVVLGDMSFSFNAGILAIDKDKAGVFDVFADD